jgi:threonyl-tRNA synthetase
MPEDHSPDSLATQVTLTFPDGSARAYPAGVTPAEVAQSIAPSLAKTAVSATLDGQHWDLRWPIERDGAIAIRTLKDAEGLELIRHDLPMSWRAPSRRSGPRPR